MSIAPANARPGTNWGSGVVVFDSTFCVAVLQHVGDVAQAIGEFARVRANAAQGQAARRAMADGSVPNRVTAGWRLTGIRQRRCSQPPPRCGRRRPERIGSCERERVEWLRA